MLGSGNYKGIVSNTSATAAAGIHDTVDLRTGRLSGSWPTISPAAVVDLLTTTYSEGSSLTFTIRVFGIDIGQTVQWELVAVAGSVLTPTDFDVVSQSFVVDNTYQKAVVLSVSSDGYTEGTEYFFVRVKHNNVIIATSANITINDTSTGSAEPSGLYTFTTFTFTAAGITGRFGPTLSQCLSSYNTAANPWLLDTAYYNQGSFQGYQLWTVPATGTYEFEVSGAAGGDHGIQYAGGLPARITTTLTLSQGTKLHLIVGQKGINGNGSTCGSNAGGGGGSFVFTQAGVCLIAAGGGGGTATVTTEADLLNAKDSTSGNKGQGFTAGGAGGTAGNGGGAPANSSCVAVGNAGAGILTVGYLSSGSLAAKPYNQGFEGGAAGAQGGFGGGGAAGSNYCGGGGGGYSGGGGGGLSGCSCSAMAGGGAGGSYSSNSTYTFANVQAWVPGTIKITKL